MGDGRADTSPPTSWVGESLAMMRCPPHDFEAVELIVLASESGQPVGAAAARIWSVVVPSTQGPGIFCGKIRRGSLGGVVQSPVQTQRFCSASPYQAVILGRERRICSQQSYSAMLNVATPVPRHSHESAPKRKGQSMKFRLTVSATITVMLSRPPERSTSC